MKLVAVIGFACMAIAPTGHGASFDCSKAKSRSEILICGSPELSRKDDDLYELYKAAKSSATDKAEFNRDNKEAWQERERNCTSVACLEAWYEKRTTALQEIVAPSLSRSASSVMADPGKVKIMECMGVKVYEDPQPAGHPPSPSECNKITSQAKATTAEPKEKSTIAERCTSQADFFTKVVASRQAGVAASTVLDMTVTSETKAYGTPPNALRSAWYRKTILSIYDNPKYLYSDPSASGMSYQDACLANPEKMLIGG